MNDKSRIIELEDKIQKIEQNSKIDNRRIKFLENTIEKIEEFMKADVKQQFMKVAEDDSRSMTFAQFVDGTYARDLDGN